LISADVAVASGSSDDEVVDERKNAAIE